MRKRFPVLLLTAAIGCSQGGAPAPVPGDSTEISASTEASIPLPDPSATVIQFFCPGMT